MKNIIIILLLINLIIIPKNVFSQYSCSKMEEPIVGDWGFFDIANGKDSPWSTTGNINFCTDDECGSTAYSLSGYYYAEFTFDTKNQSEPQTSTLTQIVELPPLDPSLTYTLEYFLSSQFETNISPLMTLYINNVAYSTYNGNLLLGDLEHVVLSGLYNMSAPLNITFTAQYIAEGSVVINPSSRNGFKIASVIIRKPQTTTFNAEELYVDVENGSDKNNNGTKESPFSTIQQALANIGENGTIYLADGTYCNLAAYLPISKSVKIQSLSGNPNATVISGEYRLSLLKASYSNNDNSFLSMMGDNYGFKNIRSSYQQESYNYYDNMDSVLCDPMFEDYLLDNIGSEGSGGSEASSTSSASSASSTSSFDSSSYSPNNNGDQLSIYITGITFGWAYSSENSPGGSALFIEGNIIARFINCIFTTCADNQNRGSISARGSAVLMLYKSTVFNCSNSLGGSEGAQVYGPAISMLGFGGLPTLSIVECNLIQNQYNILVDETKYFLMMDSNIIGSSSDSQSLCSIMLSRTTSSNINNCNISSINIGAVCIISSSTSITHSNFFENSLKNGPGGNIYISQGSSVTISQVNIYNSESNIGAAIFAMELSQVNVTDTNIYNINSSSLISSSDSQLTFSNSKIYNTVNTYTIYLFFGTFSISDSSILSSQGAFYATQTSISIVDTLFYQIFTSSHVFQDCNVVINNSNFTQQNGFFYSSFSVIDISNSFVELSQTPFIMISPLSNVTIENSKFLNNQDMVINLLSQSNLTVINTEFYNNTNGILLQYEGSQSAFYNVYFLDNNSTSNGCIFTYSQVSLVNCTAVGNNGKEGTVISTINGGLITIKGGNYTGNHADGGGGVIFYNDNQPNIFDNPIFQNNTAAYGNDIATNPSQLILDSPFPSSFQSGYSNYSGTVRILDSLNQTISGIMVKIFLQIAGNTIDSVPTNTGIAQFNQTLLYGPIGSEVNVEFLSNNPNLPIYPTTSVVDSCQPGQIPSSTKMECMDCRSGSYGYDGEKCIQCPQNAYCPSGPNVTAEPGFWYNYQEAPYTILQCPNENCPGGQYINYTGCAPHSGGPLCAVCDPGFYDWGDGCKKCDKISPIVYVAIIIGSIGMIILVQSSDSESGFMTIIVYFGQTLMVLSSGVKFSFLSLLNLQFQPSSSGGSSIFGFCPGPFDYYDQHYFTLLAAPWLMFVLFISSLIFYVIYRYKLISILKKKIAKNGANDDNDDDDNKDQSIRNYSIISTENVKNQIIKKNTEKDKLLGDQSFDYSEAGNTTTSGDDYSVINDDLSLPGYEVIADSKNTSLSKSIVEPYSLSDQSMNSSTTILENPTVSIPSNQTFLSQQYGALIKLLLNIYTPIGKATFEIFFCESVGVDFLLLIANNAVSCRTEDYRTALYVSYALLVVIIGFPSILFILLFKNRNNFNDPHSQRTYGVFILKYKSKFYFWDVILLLRRLLIILMSTMDPAAPQRSFLLVVVSLVSVLLQLRYQPFKRISDNRLELTSLSLLFICCVYLDNIVYTNIEQYIVIPSGLIFLLHTIYILYSNYRFQIKDTLNHYLYIISRGKFGRKNPNNNIFGTSSYFLYNQDHLNNDDDFSHKIIVKKNKKLSKSIEQQQNQNNNTNNDIVQFKNNSDNNDNNNNEILPIINNENNNNNNNIKELDNYDDSDYDYDYDTSQSEDDDEENNNNNNNETTSLLGNNTV